MAVGTGTLLGSYMDYLSYRFASNLRPRGIKLFDLGSFNVDISSVLSGRRLTLCDPNSPSSRLSSWLITDMDESKMELDPAEAYAIDCGTQYAQRANESHHFNSAVSRTPPVVTAINFELPILCCLFVRAMSEINHHTKVRSAAPWLNLVHEMTSYTLFVPCIY